MPTPVDHPLSALIPEEIECAVGVLRGTGRLTEDARFAYVGLNEPDKSTVKTYKAGDPIDRELRLVIVTDPVSRIVETVVSVSTKEIRSWVEMEDVRPSLLFEESFRAIQAVHADPTWRAAMERRGITDFEAVQIDPWPAGSFGLAVEADRRICRCLSYVRDSPQDNGYAKPVEGVVAFVDMARGEVLEVVDHGVIPVPADKGSYLPEDNQPVRQGLKPLEIHQPEGPSFTVEGNRISWQQWSLRVAMDPTEGLVLHTVSITDHGRERSVLHRASVTEMVVPYGEPGPMHGWKNAFDAGEWGLGRMANSLVNGCDCLGEVRYLDTACCSEGGHPYVQSNVVCIHEEDYGILWKHNDMLTGRTEVRRSRRLVVSSIATVGNYEYGFYWYFYLDGTLQLEVKLTGILSTMAVAPGEPAPKFASMIAPQLAAPFHQHMFNVRLDVEIDGEDNCVEEVDVVAYPAGPDNPMHNAFEKVTTLLESELEACRLIDPSRSRVWRIINRKSLNGLGMPVAYKLLPGASPTLLAGETSSVYRRAGFATKNVWVTRFDPTERRAAGDHPNQHQGGDGLPRFVSQNRNLVDQDIVVWYTFGLTHIPRPEDWPVMPVEYTGFSLIPSGFFDRNPALDVPASVACEAHHNTGS
ncbi:MAG: primary-amine oxidase [Acidimicrobiales bacterium]